MGGEDRAAQTPVDIDLTKMFSTFIWNINGFSRETHGKSSGTNQWYYPASSRIHCTYL